MNLVPLLPRGQGPSPWSPTASAGSEQSADPGGTIESGSTSSWVAVLFLSLLALALRFFAIDHDSLWHDEAITRLCTKVPILDLITGRVVLDQGNPPFYWMLGGAWDSLFGDSEVGLRSLPALCGVLTIPFLFLVGRRLLSPRVGLWGAFLLAVSPTAIELSNEARPYSLVGLLAVMATWFFVRWVQENRGLDLAFYSVAVFLTCATHHYGGVVPLAHAAGLATLPRGHRRLGSWLGAMVVAGLLGLSVLSTLLVQLRTRGNLIRLGDRWLTQFLATPMVFGFGRNLAWRDSPAWMLGGVTLAALVCFWLPALFALTRYRWNPFGVVVLGSWAFIPIVVPLAVAVTLSPMYATRYAFVGLPAFLLLTGWGLEQFRPTVRRALILSILVLTSLSLYGYATKPLKDDWRSETRFVLERLRPGELVVFEPDFEIATFLYYAPRYGPAPPEMVALTSKLRNGGPFDGLRYRNGILSDRGPRDCKNAVTSSSGLWLVLCASAEKPESFRDYFVREGLQLVGHRRSDRIEIFHFVRETGPEQPVGGWAA
jgi:mannosyltransferase